MHEVRPVLLFRLNGELVLEIPEGWEFPEGDVEMWKDGDALVIRPARQEEQPSGSIDRHPCRP